MQDGNMIGLVRDSKFFPIDKNDISPILRR